MLRIILAAIVGFIVWTILWLGSEAVLSALSPGWFGKDLEQFKDAINNQAPYAPDSMVLVLGLIRSIVCSLAAGYAAALVAKENIFSTLLCGVLLLLFGIFIGTFIWNYVPLWYHIPFLLLLIPVTVLGGRLKRQS